MNTLTLSMSYLCNIFIYIDVYNSTYCAQIVPKNDYILRNVDFDRVAKALVRGHLWFFVILFLISLPVHHQTTYLRANIR